jgi:hypothetical protein
MPMERITLPQTAFQEVPLARLCLEPGLTSALISPDETRTIEIDRMTAQFPGFVKEGEVSFPGVRVYKFNRAGVIGADTIVREKQVVFVDRAHPPYVPPIFPAEDREKFGTFRSERVESRDPIVTISHWNARTYGHFLLEVLPKIVVFQKIRAVYPKARLLVSDYLGPALTGILEQLIAPEAMLRFDFRHQHLLAKSVILIDCLADESVIHPLMHEFVDLVLERLPQQTRTRRIFLSRANWRAAHIGYDYRILDNEAEIAGRLAEFGFDVIEPETLPWLEQIALCAHAEMIVGEYSSALHNSLFAPPGTRVIGLNRANGMQEAIAGFAGHRVGLLLPTDGIPRRWETYAATGVEQNFTVDADQVVELVRRELDGSAS